MTRRRLPPEPLCLHPANERGVLELHPGTNLHDAPVDPAARVVEAPFCTRCGAVLSDDPTVLEALA